MKTIRRYWFVIVPVGITTLWIILNPSGFQPFKGLVLSVLVDILFFGVAVYVDDKYGDNLR
jgi:hypothetical protein